MAETYLDPVSMTYYNPAEGYTPPSTHQNVTATYNPQAPSAAPAAVSVDQLNPATPIKVPTAQPKADPLAPAAASAQAASKALETQMAEYFPETETRGQYDALSEDIQSLLPGLGGRGQAQLDAEQAAGITEQKKKLADINAQILMKVAEATKTDQSYEQLIQQIESQQGVPMSAITGQQAQQRKLQLAERNSKAADLGLLTAFAQGMQGQVAAAQEGVNRAIDLKYQDKEDTINLKMQQLKLLEGKLNKEEEVARINIERKYQAEQQKIAEKKEKEKYNISLAMETGVQTRFANKLGEFYNAATGEAAETPEQFFKMAGVKSFEEAYARGLVTDISGYDMLNERKFRFEQDNEQFNRGVKEQELALKWQELAGKGTGLNIDPANIPTYQMDSANGMMDAYNALSVNLTEAARKSGDATLANLINRGDIAGAKEFVMSTAISAAPLEQKNKAYGRNEALNALDDLQSMLAQYEAKGGDTGFFEGKIEDLQNKIGKTSDPELAKIQSQIRLSILDYRKAISGAAFTETEAQEYDRLFPSIGKVSAFNKAAIDSLKQSFTRNQRSFLETLVGPSAAQSLLTPVRPPIEKLMIDDKRVNDAMNALLGQGIKWDVARAKLYENLGFSPVGKTSASIPAIPLKTGQDLATSLKSVAPAGAFGGQCGVFIRNMAKRFGLDYPKLGDTLASKTAVVQKYGVPISQAKIGSVMVTNESKDTGHVAWIIGQNSQGFIVAESNYNLNEKVNYGRVIPFNSSKIVGVINPKPTA